MKNRINDLTLSVRAKNIIQGYWYCLTGSDVSADHNPTVEEVRTELLSLRLNPATARGYGKTTHAELCMAVGVAPEICIKIKPIKINPKWKFHPMTGESLSQTNQ